MPDQSHRGAVLVTRAAHLLTRYVVRPLANNRAWLAAHAVVLALLAAGIVVALGAAGVAGEVYESVEEGGDLAALDRPALEAAQRWRTPSRNDLVTTFTDIGGTVGFPILAVGLLGMTSVALWLGRRRPRERTPGATRTIRLVPVWEPVVLGMIAVPVALAMSTVGKAVVDRPRPPLSEAVPPHEHSPSFPSGHTTMSTALMVLMAYLLVRYVQTLWIRVLGVLACASFAVAMGLSRVYLGHHWLTDVAAGWALATGWVVAFATLHQTWLLIGPTPGTATRPQGAAARR